MRTPVICSAVTPSASGAAHGEFTGECSLANGSPIAPAPFISSA
jgi:hypothetical protein